jgi:hypothetical protein
MARLNPNEFDAFQRGEPNPVLLGKTDNRQLDYFSRGEVLGAVVPFIYAPAGTASISGGGALTVTGKKAARATSTLSGNGSLTVIGKKAARGTATTAGGGTVAATDHKNALSTVTVTGGGTLTATGTATVTTPPVVVTVTETGGNIILVPPKRKHVPYPLEIIRFGSTSLSGGGRVISTGTKNAVGHTDIHGGGTIHTTGFKSSELALLRYQPDGTFTSEPPDLEAELQRLLEDALVLSET